MYRSLRFEATRLAGRMVASGGAVLCGGWREEGDGGEGAGIEVWGARVGGWCQLLAREATLDILTDPDRREHDEIAKWRDTDVEPEVFSVGNVNKTSRAMFG